MSRLLPAVRSLVVPAVAAGLLLGCSSGGDSAKDGDTELPTSSSDASDTTPGSDTSSVSVPADSGVPTTASTTVPATPWREDAATALTEVLGAMEGTGDEVGIAQRWFALPVTPPIPADAALSGAYLRASLDADGAIEVRWDVRFATATATAAEIEAAVVSGFADPRFVAGVRVVSDLDDGEFVTLNYPTTDEGLAAGWQTLSFSIGPETDIDGPTGKQRLVVNASRTVSSLADLGLPGFLTAWVEQFPPLPDGVTFAELEADLVNLSTRGIWITSRATTPSDRYPSLIDYFSKDWSSGDLQYGSSPTPGDIATNDYFTAGSSPTLAGYTAWVTTTRSLDNPDEPARVEYQVRVEESTR